MELTGTESNEAARAIRAMDREFVVNAQARDAARLVNAFYAPDAKVMPPNSPPVEGTEAILSFWKAVLGSGVTGIDLNTTHIAASGDLAYAVGSYTMTREAPAEQRGEYLVVYRRQPDGSWRAIVDMFSPNA
jgi:uncharacterized protein (TIGR02246 family)